MAMNLDPAMGVELAEIATKFCNETVLNLVSDCYAAMRSLGDDSDIVEQFKQRYMAAQNYYNNTMTPAFDAFKNSAEEFTDAAEYIKKISVNTSVKETEVRKVGAGQFDAARNL